jgi:hypothetical protein
VSLASSSGELIVEVLETRLSTEKGWSKAGLVGVGGRVASQGLFCGSSRVPCD